LRRLVLLSALLILAGLALLLPTSALYSVLTTGSTTSAILSSIGGTDDSSTIEAMLGFGLIGVGVVLEIFSLFTDFGSAAPTALEPMTEEPQVAPLPTNAQSEPANPNPSGWAVSSAPTAAKDGEKA
jgi:hypothetical protein